MTAQSTTERRAKRQAAAIEAIYHRWDETRTSVRWSSRNPTCTKAPCPHRWRWWHRVRLRDEGLDIDWCPDCGHVRVSTTGYDPHKTLFYGHLTHHGGLHDGRV